MQLGWSLRVTLSASFILAASYALGPAAVAVAEDTASLPIQIVPQVSSRVDRIALSRDGSLAATASKESVNLWQVETGRLLRSLKGHSGDITAIAFSPDGAHLATGTEHGGIDIWELATGQVTRSLAKPSGLLLVTTMTFSADGGQILAGGSLDMAVLWNVASGQQLRVFKTDGDVSAVAISPDGNLIATHDEKTIDLWKVEGGSPLWAAPAPIVSLSGQSLTFTDDGRRLLATLAGVTAGIWGVSSPKPVRFLNGDEAAHAVFSPDGNEVIASGDSGVHLLDVATSRVSNIVEGNTYPTAVSADGRRVAAVASGAVTIWDAATRAPLRKLDGRASAIASLAYSADGARIAVGSVQGKAQLWSASSGRLLSERPVGGSAVTCVGFLPDGRLVTSNGDMFVWSDAGSIEKIGKGGEVVSVSEQGKVTNASMEAKGNFFTISKDGEKIAVGDGIWDLASGNKLAQLNRGDNPIGAVSFSPDGKSLATAASDQFSASVAIVTGKHKGRSATIWDVSSGRLIRPLAASPDELDVASFAPDGSMIATGSLNDSAALWNASSGKLLRKLPGHVGAVNAVAFSPDGLLVATGGEDRSIRLWQTRTGQLVRTLDGSANSLAFSPDGSRLIAGGGDAALRVWSTANGTELGSMIAFANGEWVTITPEGFFDTSTHGAENLVVVQGLESYSIDQVYQALYRPDLVVAKLAGDPDGKVAAAAAELDLTKVIESGGAPKVVITSPSEGSSIATDSIDVEAAVTDAGGGIGKIEWRVNGVTLGIGARGFDRLAAGDAASGSGKTVSVKQTLSLDPGDNRIEVVAYNEKGLIASEPVAVSVKWDGASAATPPKLYVLTVGVNDYWDGRLKLTYAAPDAKAIGDAFRESGEKLYSGVDVTTVLDADVTAAHLDEVFAEEAKKVRPRDVFVFFMAGHGKTQDGRYYFLPQDFRYEDASSIAKGGIDQDRLQAWFAQIPARKSVLLYDTCDSGSLTAAGAGQRGLEQVAALERMTRAMGRTVLSASTDDAPALEGYKGHGVFTYAVLDALGDADANKDGLIEVTELAGAIDKNVPDISYAAFKLRQVPQMSLVGSDFPLADQVAVLDVGAYAGAATIPTEPTHVVIADVDVHESADVTSATVTVLSPGTQVRLIETANGWTLIGRDGVKVGYVVTNALASLH